VAGLGLVGGGLLATMAKSPTARKVGIAAAAGGLLVGAVSLALVARTPIDEREAP
jgi:membrane associated rhomboid family serine protease